MCYLELRRNLNPDIVFTSSCTLVVWLLLISLVWCVLLVGCVYSHQCLYLVHVRLALYAIQPIQEYSASVVWLATFLVLYPFPFSQLHAHVNSCTQRIEGEGEPGTEPATLTIVWQELIWSGERFSFLVTQVVKKENHSSLHVHRSNWEISTIQWSIWPASGTQGNSSHAHVRVRKRRENLGGRQLHSLCSMLRFTL